MNIRRFMTSKKDTIDGNTVNWYSFLKVLLSIIPAPLLFSFWYLLCMMTTWRLILFQLLKCVFLPVSYTRVCTLRSYLFLFSLWLTAKNLLVLNWQGAMWISSRQFILKYNEVHKNLQKTNFSLLLKTLVLRYFFQYKRICLS